MTWPGRCFTQSELNGCKEIVPQSQTGRRVCDSPEPQYGGLQCAGEETVTRDCYQCNQWPHRWPHVCAILRIETIPDIDVSTNLSVGPLIENVSRAMLMYTCVEPH